MQFFFRTMSIIEHCRKLSDEHYEQEKTKLPDSAWKYKQGKKYYLEPRYFDSLRKQRDQFYIEQLEKAILAKL